MPKMTEKEVALFFKKSLSDASLLQFLSSDRSQFLEVDGFFVEIVINDGSAIGDARRVSEVAAQELRQRGVKLDLVVRALWFVEDIEHVGIAPNDSGGHKAAVRFRALLVSGAARHTINIDVTRTALETIQCVLGERLPSSNVERNRLVGNVAAKFLSEQLERGGTNYWDPVGFPHQELNAVALRSVLSHATTEVAK